MPSYSGGGGGLPPGVSGDGNNGLEILGLLRVNNAPHNPVAPLLIGDGSGSIGLFQVEADGTVLTRGIEANDILCESVNDAIPSLTVLKSGSGMTAPIVSIQDENAGDLLGVAAAGGHLLPAGAAPSVTHNGVNTTGTVVRATDLRGVLNLVLTSTGSAANAELCTVTFAVAYAAAPIIVVSALDDTAATALPLGSFYIDQTTTPLTTFMLKCTSALAAGTYRCSYVVLG